MTDVDTAIQEYREAHARWSTATAHYADAMNAARKAEDALRAAQTAAKEARERLILAIGGPLPQVDWRVTRKPNFEVS